MKKQLLSFLLLLAFVGTTFITGCKKDKDGDLVSIIGTWKTIKSDFVDFYGGIRDEYSVVGDPADHVKFNADGTFEDIFKNDNDEIVTNVGTWELTNSKTLRISEQGDVSSLDIKNLTANELIIYFKETDGDDYSEETYYFSR